MCHDKKLLQIILICMFYFHVHNMKSFSWSSFPIQQAGKSSNTSQKWLQLKKTSSQAGLFQQADSDPSFKVYLTASDTHSFISIHQLPRCWQHCQVLARSLSSEYSPISFGIFLCILASSRNGFVTPRAIVPVGN